MKTRLFLPYVIFVGSLMTCLVSNAMDLEKMRYHLWLNILHVNNVPSPKAEECAKLIPHFLSKHPQIAAEFELSGLVSSKQPMPMQIPRLNEFCDKLLEVSKKDEL